MNSESEWHQLLLVSQQMLDARSSGDLGLFCEQIPVLNALMDGIQANNLPPDTKETQEKVAANVQELMVFINQQLPLLRASINSSANSIKLNRVYG